MQQIDETLKERDESAASWFLEFMLAFLMPPIAVLLNRGPGREFVISIPLTALGYLPGIVYAFYIIISGMSEMTPIEKEKYNEHEGGLNNDNKNTETHQSRLIS